MSFNITIREFTANVASNTFGGVAEVPVANRPDLLIDTGTGLRPTASATIRINFWAMPWAGGMIAKIQGNAANQVPKNGEASPILVLIDGAWQPAKATVPVGLRSSISNAVAALWTAALAGGPTEVKDATGVKRTASTPTANPAAVAAANQELTDLKALVAQQAQMLQALMANMAAAAAPAAEAEAPKADAKATTKK
jgi:hypothetical protein